MRLAAELMLVAAITLAFMAVHEAGHFTAALCFGLSPQLVFGGSASSNLAGGVMGVEHTHTDTARREIIILSALVPPFAAGWLFRSSKNDLLKHVGTALLILSTTALIPFPGSDTAVLLSLAG